MGKKEVKIKEKKSKNNGNKYKGFSSMKINIILMNVILVLATTVVFLAVAIPEYSNQISVQAHDNMENQANAYGQLVNTALSSSGILSAEKLDELLGDVSLAGVESSYAYLVSKDGFMLYHPTADKIGKPVENDVVKGLVAEIESGKVPEPAVKSYEFKGETKYAGYYITSISKNILVVTADEKDILSPVTKFTNKVLGLAVFLILISIVFAWIMGRKLAQPFIILTDVVNKTSDFNFETNDRARFIVERKDESGEIARAIQTMRANLRAVVKNIDETSMKLSQNAKTLSDVTNSVNEHSSDNSATSEELAAGMQETSATTENINAGIGNVEEHADNINKLTVEGKEISKEIQLKAERIEKKVEEGRRKSEEMYSSVKEKSDLALEQAKAVNKINDLTKSIMDIAGQTSLLSLNASIEAARAGESGRGFAVVAEQIGNLANQSAETVSDITKIVEEVHESVTNMSQCLKVMQEFLENNIAKDYENFTSVSQQYNNDAHVFQTSMEDINSAIDTLTSTIHEISESISGINHTIGEATVGVTDIAQKTSDIVNLTSKTYEMVEDSITYSNELKGIVNQFKLQ